MLVPARRAAHAKPSRHMSDAKLTATVYVGIDISAAELVCATVPVQHRLRRAYPNSARGVATLLTALGRLAAPVLVVAEATGTFHVRLQDALAEADVACALLQPLAMTHYARMKGARTKSDPVDAALLARYGAEQTPPPSTPPSAAQRQITQLTTTRRGMVEARTRLQNQITALARLPSPDRVCLRELRGLLVDLGRRILRVEAARDAVVAASYGREVRLLTTIKGIGRQTSAALVAYAGDLSGFASPRQLVAYVGMDPVQRHSGTSLHVHGGISKRGNRHLRTLLYMGAQTARKHNAACRALYERLIGRGKTKKQALVAVASKLARQAWAVLHHGRPYEDGLGLSP